MPRRTNRSFLYTDRMRWEPLEVPDSQGRAWTKTLSKDEETGARTMLIKYDPGFRQKKAGSTWPADIYVLEGEMKVGNRLYQPHTFHYRPASVQYGPTESPKGCTRIVFTADSKDKSSEEEVFIQDVQQMDWGVSYADPTGQRLGLKTLRRDPIANISILVHSAFGPIVAVDNQYHVHDHVEEVFILEGDFEDYLGEVDGHCSWLPGLYVCRPPNESPHGDSRFYKTPVRILIRRGWAGEGAKFYDSLHEHSPNKPIPPAVTFKE